MRNTCLAFVFGLAPLLFVACESEDAHGCVPGEVRECPCGGGLPDGTQTCNEDGGGWGECDCGGGGDGDTDSDTDADADSDADTDADGDTDTDEGTDSGTEPGDCDGGRYDPVTGLCWQHPKADGIHTWQQAVALCADLDLEGHADWQLPGRQDFVDLLGGCDEGVLAEGAGYCQSCADSQKCTALFGPDANWYWSSSQDTSGSAWAAGFGTGAVYEGYTGIVYHVRCVR